MELTARLAEDLDEAFPDLIRDLQDPVYSTALQLVRNRHDAEDLTQETFVRVYRALSGFTATSEAVRVDDAAQPFTQSRPVRRSASGESH